VKKILLGAALAASALVPPASAGRPHCVKLALVPLPKSAIGAAAQSFPLAYDSGPVSNANAAAHTPDATPKTFKRMGRLNGYALEYGNAFTGAAGVTDVRTSVEEYKTAADARRALAFWKREDARLSRLDSPAFSRSPASP
jgi:opacity protein-like surface antigen